jgi:ATP-dependent DNA helicase RecG
VVSNILVHREFSNPFPAKLVIEKERVFVENSNKPHGNGTIDPGNFSPFPKNPTIAKFFKEIGRVDELGSGVRNTYKYNKIYSGAEPTFIESDVFRTIIPLKPKHSGDQASDQVSDQVSDHAGDQVSDQDDRTKEILEFCKVPKSRSEIQDFLEIKSKRYLRTKILNPLIKGGLLKLTIPDKPTSPKQKYYTDNR